jgi:hypothetical protein
MFKDLLKTAKEVGPFFVLALGLAVKTGMVGSGPNTPAIAKPKPKTAAAAGATP